MGDTNTRFAIGAKKAGKIKNQYFQSIAVFCFVYEQVIGRLLENFRVFLKNKKIFSPSK
jgi:hypothetical protein